MSFEQIIYNVSSTPLIYENTELLEKALSCMPIEQFYLAAEKKDQENSPWGLQDNVVIELLSWFKNSFFKWVTKPECTNCGSETCHIGNGEPNEQEKKGRPGNVEIYGCNNCRTIIRYPRYNDPGKLLETRNGRCGEFANCFALLCRALGCRVRYVWNSEDHVWTEVYSEKQARWVHADSCENAWDKPLLYTDGWGKKMAYVIGFSADGAMDISKRYVRRQEMALPRNKISEDKLNDVLFHIISSRRANMDAQDIMSLQDEDDFERAELESYNSSTSLSNKTPTASVGPRESGKGEWTKSRGEDGAK